MTTTTPSASPAAAATSEATDSELLARVRTGEAAAYGVLWHRHVKVALVVAGQYSTIADPEDIVQEAFQAVFVAIANGAGPHSEFRPYLNRTVRNTAVNISRRKRADPVGGMEDVADELDLSVEAADEQSVERMVLAQAFQSLPERWRAVLWLIEVEDVPVKDAAARLGLTPNAAAALALRAREGLRRAWLASHTADKDLSPECRWTVDHLPVLGRGATSEKDSRRIQEHIASCVSCAASAQEIGELSRRLPALLVPVVLASGEGAMRMLGSALPTSVPAASGSAAAPAAKVGSVAVLGRVTRKPLLMALAVLALVVCLGLGVDRLLGSGRSDDTTTEQSLGGDQAISDDGASELPDSPVPPTAAGDVAAPDQQHGIEAEPTETRATDDAAAPVQSSGDEGGQTGGSPSVGDGTPPAPEQVDATPAPASNPAAALTVTRVPAPGLREWLPAVGGRGAPGRAVEAVLADGTVVGAADVAADGTWSLVLSRDTVADVAHVVGVRYSGETAQVPVGTFTLVAPIPKGIEAVGASGGLRDIFLLVSGTCSRSLEAVLDGTGDPQVFTLGECVSRLPFSGLAPGTHTVDLRYVDEAVGRAGAVRTYTFVVE